MDSKKRKYPKSFYDDGLGDMLEWIDDEILIPSELRSRQSSSRSDTKNTKTKKESNKFSLYGENDLDSAKRSDVAKKVKFLQRDEEGVDIKVGKGLEERIRGLLNRLTAQTMSYVVSEFIKLYSCHSRNSISLAIFGTLELAIINKSAIAKRKIVAELMLLISYLSHKVSHNIGASLVHFLVDKFEKLYSQNQTDEEKLLDNIIYCLVNLHTIGLITTNVIYAITRRICDPKSFRPKSVELLLIVIKSIGFQLRKDNPSLMKQLIFMAQDSCRELKSNQEVNKKIEFMIEALTAIKNNNVNKIGNYGCDIDKDLIESVLKSLTQRTKLPESLNDASYEEILSSANWYTLDQRVDEEDEDSKTGLNKPDFVSSKKELKICKALGLSKPAERTIFSALLRVSDYVEASNTIIGFGLNHCSDSLIVIIQVAICEKKYNTFHFNLINNLCKFNRRYKMAAKFSIQDKIRVINELPSNRVDNFKQLCFELIKSDAIPITILKSIEWANLNQSTKEFLVFLIRSISELGEDERCKIMSKVEKRSAFISDLRDFTNCFLEDCVLFQ